MPRTRKSSSVRTENVISEEEGILKNKNILCGESYIVFDKNLGITKCSKKAPSVNTDQVAFKLVVEIPEEVFQARTQTVKAKLSKSFFGEDPKISSTIEMIEI